EDTEERFSTRKALRDIHAHLGESLLILLAEGHQSRSTSTIREEMHQETGTVKNIWILQGRARIKLKPDERGPSGYTIQELKDGKAKDLVRTPQLITINSGSQQPEGIAIFPTNGHEKPSREEVMIREIRSINEKISSLEEKAVLT